MASSLLFSVITPSVKKIKHALLGILIFIFILSGSVSLIAAGVNTSPRFNGGITAYTDPGSTKTGNILRTVTDDEGDTLTITQFDAEGVPYSSFTEQSHTFSDGSYLNLHSDGSYEFTPIAGSNSYNFIDMYVTDGEFTIASVVTFRGNYVPQLIDDTVTVPYEGSSTINALENDSDPIDTLRITFIFNFITQEYTRVPTEGLLNYEIEAGYIDVMPNGNVTFRAKPSMSGTFIDEIGLFISDGYFGVNSEIRFVILPEPVATSVVDDIFTVDYSTTLNDNVLANDIVDNSKTLIVDTITINGNVLLNAGLTVSLEEGDVTIQENGDITFVPYDGFWGNVTPISYQAFDGTDTFTAQVTITVQAPEILPPEETINTAPVGEHDTYIVDTDGMQTYNILANDTDSDEDTLTVEYIMHSNIRRDFNESGTWTLESDYGTVTVSRDGTLTFERNGVALNPDLYATLHFSYVLTDGIDSGTADVLLLPRYETDTLTAVNDTFKGYVGQTITRPLQENDINTKPNTDMQVVAIESQNGYITNTLYFIDLNVNSAVAMILGVCIVNITELYDQPTLEFNYYVTNGTDISQARVTIDITSEAPHLPVAVDDEVTVEKGNSVSGNVTDNDYATDGFQFIVGGGYLLTEEVGTDDVSIDTVKPDSVYETVFGTVTLDLYGNYTINVSETTAAGTYTVYYILMGHQNAAEPIPQLNAANLGELRVIVPDTASSSSAMSSSETTSVESSISSSESSSVEQSSQVQSSTLSSLQSSSDTSSSSLSSIASSSESESLNSSQSISSNQTSSSVVSSLSSSSTSSSPSSQPSVTVQTPNGFVTITITNPGQNECNTIQNARYIQSNGQTLDGFVGFDIPCTSTVTVTLAWRGLNTVNALELLKYNPTTGETFNLNSNWQLQTIDGEQVAVMTYTLTDGERGDLSGKDGIIVDPVGVAEKNSKNSAVLVRSGGYTSGTIAFITLAVLLLTCVSGILLAFKEE